MVTTQAQCEPWLQAGEAAITRPMSVSRSQLRSQLNSLTAGGLGTGRPDTRLVSLLAAPASSTATSTVSRPPPSTWLLSMATLSARATETCRENTLAPAWVR